MAGCSHAETGMDLGAPEGCRQFILKPIIQKYRVLNGLNTVLGTVFKNKEHEACCRQSVGFERVGHSYLQLE